MSGKTTFQGKSVIIKRATPYRTYDPINDTRFWCDQWQDRESGGPSQLLLGDDLSLLVDEATVIASDIAVMGDITDKHGRKITKDQPRFLVFQDQYYYWHSKKNSWDKWQETQQRHYLYKPTFSVSGEVDLNFDVYKLAHVLLTAASALMEGESFLLGSDTSRSSPGAVAVYGRIPLLPAILGMVGGIMQRRSVTENPYAFTVRALLR